MFHLSDLWNRRKDDLILGRIANFPFAPLVRLPAAARSGHLYIIGSTGKGKSKLLEYLVCQDIAAGRGCGVVDPHSLLADDLLRNVLSRKVLDDPSIRNRLIYIDPARTDYVVPFNVLANPAEHPYDIAVTILEAFRRTWPDSLKEAPHFTNVIVAALIALIENHLTLMHLQPLLTNRSFREKCLAKVQDREVVEFFHQRYDRWEERASLRNESILNKVGVFALNPRLRLMLGQQENRLDFRAIMDEEKILILDLGRSDLETNRLIGSLVVTGIELAMRRRKNRTLWNLVIDEFAEYVASDGSTETLAQVFAQGRKFGLSLTVAHQDLSQLSHRTLGALSNVQTKVIFGVGRPEAEYFGKLIGRVEPEEVKREPKTETQRELFSPLSEQWERWVDHLRFQPDRHAMVATRDGRVTSLRTFDIPSYAAMDDQVEAVRLESLRQYGIPYAAAKQKVHSVLAGSPDSAHDDGDVPPSEIIE